MAISTRQILICVFLPLVVLAVFWPATRNGFVNYDDPTYVLDNRQVQAGLTRASVQWALTSGYAANWHPLTWVSHMLDCQFFGLRPRGHHLTSILLHALNTLLAYLALRKLTGSTWRSLCVAALFGLHPLRVESVAWVSERKDVLSTFFWLATLWAYAAWVERTRAQRAGARWFYLLSLGCLGLGLMSKPMLVTVPCVLLLLDYWPLRRLRPEGSATPASLVVEKLPFLALALAACVITFVVQRQAGAVKGSDSFPFPIRLENAVVSYAQYLGKFFHPVDLAVFYPHAGARLAPVIVAFSTVLLAGITGISVWQWRARPWMAVGWLWYLGTLVPAIGLIQVGAQAMADRYTYIPLLGFAMALVWTAHDLAVRWRVPSSACAVGAALAVAVCAALTRTQVGYWKDSETLFRHTLAVTNRNAMAHVNLGIALDDRGATQEAISELERALQIAPDLSAAHLNLGVLLDAAGQTDQAVEHLLRATELEPNLAEGYFCLARAFYRQKRLPGAIAAYQQALRLNPDHAEAHLKLGSIYFELRQYDNARAQYQEVLRLRPDSADACNNIGSTLFAQGRLDDALPYYEKALRLQPSHADARRNLEALQAARAAASGH